MKVIIAGSRSLPVDHPAIYYVADAYLKSGLKATEIVSGGCRGVDLAGEAFAQERGIPIKRFIPDWDTHGKAAGPIRNKQMAEYGDALIAIWDGISRGTGSMVSYAEAKKLRVFIYYIGPE